MEESRTSVLNCAFFTILDFSTEPKLVFVAAERGSGNCFFAFSEMMVNKFFTLCKV